MKLKFYVHTRPGKFFAGTTLADDAPRADMYLPAWMLTLGMLFVAFGVIAGTVLIVLQIAIPLVILVALLVLYGIATIMCWKNQTIRMLTDDTFEYSTFLGNKTVYRFDDIKGVKNFGGTMTLLVGDAKVYIESTAIVSDRLAERIDRQAKKIKWK